MVGKTNYWHNTTVLTIIRDERYTGKMVSGKNRSLFVGSKHGKRVPKSEWIVVPNTHEAIVSEELFASVQDRFSAPVRVRTEPAEVRPLTSKVKCGVCRHAMRRSNSPSATAYYYCESHQYVADSKCPKDRISEIRLAQTVLSLIQKQVEVMLDIARIFDRVKTRSHNDITILTEQIRQLQASLSKLKASKVKAYEKYKDGTLDRDSYISRKADIGKQIAETDVRITELEIALQSLYQENGQPCPILENFKRYEGFTELSKEMTNELIDSIYIYGNEAIEIVWNHMDEYMRLVQYAEKGVCVDENRY